ncbi:hypothetical protein LJR225_002331 [Phenylobacterium sp. LjRoot225]|uniref:hypothetical protein n=1 Tax=Phenylobacterium sp. LjRoot225 TaxID=3342285 RepID=UPI003ECE3614
MSDKTSRELTPADLRMLEPDLLGAIGFALYGREAAPPQRPPRDRRRPQPRSPGERAV